MTGALHSGDEKKMQIIKKAKYILHGTMYSNGQLTVNDLCTEREKKHNTVFSNYLTNIVLVQWCTVLCVCAKTET